MYISGSKGEGFTITADATYDGRTKGVRALLKVYGK
jgi:hypothetical protein